MKKLLLFLVLVLMPGVCLGANVYVRQGAAGSANGTDWTNAYTDIPDTEGTSSAVARGDTIYIADGAYGSQTFSIPASGSTYIYVKKATVTDHGTDTGWAEDNSYGDGVATFTGKFTISTSYWEFNGQVGAGFASTAYGFRLLASADMGSSKTYTCQISASNIRFQYMDVSHIVGGTYDSHIFYMNTGSTLNNLYWGHNYLHNATLCAWLVRSVFNSTWEYNYVSTRDTSTTGNHGEVMSIGTSGTASNLANNIVRYNVSKDWSGTCNYAFLDTESAGWDFYGNVAYDFITSNGVIGCDTDSYNLPSPPSHMKIYNNTFVDLTYANNGIYFNGNDVYVYNNLWYNCQNVSFSGTTHDYNAFSDNSHGESNAQIINSSFFTNYAGDDFTLAKATDPGIDLITWTPPVVTTTPTTIPTTTIPGETTIPSTVPTTAPTTTPTTVPGGTVTCTAANHLLFYWGCEGTVDQTDVDVGISCSSSIAFKDYGGCSQGNKLLIGSIIQDVVTAADQPCVAASNACLCPKTTGETGDDLCNADVSDYAIPVGDRVCVSPDSAERFIYPIGTTNYGKVIREDIGTMKFLFSVYNFNNVDTDTDYVFIAAPYSTTYYLRFFLESTYPRTAATSYLSFTRRTGSSTYTNVNLSSKKVGITEKAWYAATYNWKQLTNGIEPSMRLEICDYNTTTHATSNCYENEVTTVLPAWTAYCTLRAGGKDPPCFRENLHIGNWEHTTALGAVLIDEIYIYDDWRE